VITAVPVIMVLVFETLYHDIQYLRWMAHYQQRTFPKRRVVAQWAVGCVLLALLF